MSEKRSTRRKFLPLIGLGGVGAALSAPGPARAHHTSGRVRDEGVLLPHRETIDFRGAGVTAADDVAGNRTRVTVPGSTGGGGATPTDVGMDLARDFGVTGYLPTENKRDEHAGIQQAMDTLVREGGTLHVNPRRRYFHGASIVVNNTARPWRICGQGGWHHQNVDLTTFVYGGGQGAPPGWDIQSTLAFEIDHLRFSHDNVAFDGLQMDLDWGAPAMDPMLWSIHDCGFNAQVESNALAGVRLNHAIIGSLYRNHFGRFRHGIRLAEPSGTYVVGVWIHSNTFNFYREAAIAIGSSDLESVRIGPNNVFEDPTGATAIKGLPGNACYSLTIEDNWWGDCTAPSKWVDGLNAQSNLPCVIEKEQFNDVGGDAGSHLGTLTGMWKLADCYFAGGKLFDSAPGSLELDFVTFNNMVSLWPVQPQHLTTSHVNSVARSKRVRDTHKALLIGGRDEANPFWLPAPEDGDSQAQLVLGQLGFAGGPRAPVPPGMAALYTTGSGPTAANCWLQASCDHPSREVGLVAGTNPEPKVRCNGAGVGFNGQPGQEPPAVSDNPTNAEIAAALKQLGLCR